MRVLYLITKADRGGAQVHLLDLLRGFRQMLEPVVAVGEEGYFSESVRRLDIPCHIVPSLVHPIAPMKDARAILDVARLIRILRPDVLHAHTSKAGLVGRLAALATRVPAVFTAHTWCFAEGTSPLWRLAGLPAERIAGWCSSAIINVSEANRKLALRHGVSGEKRMVTIWNGIPDTPHRAKPSSSGIPKIVMVARFVPQKDQRSLVCALAGIDDPVKLLFVGDGPTLADVRSEVERLRQQDRVEYLGARGDIAEILAKSHIFALSTNWEGFPLSILEAMRAGLPTVVSDVGGASEAVVDGSTGFLVPKGDVAAWTDRLSRLIRAPDLRHKMGTAARIRYANNFTLDRMLRKTSAVYQMAAFGVHAASVLQYKPARITKAPANSYR